MHETETETEIETDIDELQAGVNLEGIFEWNPHNYHTTVGASINQHVSNPDKHHGTWERRNVGT